MSACCLKRYNGLPVSGGGVAPPAAVGWNHVYEVDFRDAFASLGAVDLNSAGATFTYENITWATPSIANSGVDQNNTSGSWGLTANGLEVIGQGGGGIAATGASFTHIFANLADIAANNRTPFSGDPTRQYLFQCYVSATTALGAGDESGMGLYRVSGNFPVGSGSESATFNTYGFNGAVARMPSATCGTGASPTRQNRVDLAFGTSGTDFDCPTIHYAASGKLQDQFAASYSALGDWPSEATLRSIGSYAATSQFSGNVPGDPFVSMRAALGHAGGGFDATIQRFRLCQL